MGQRLVSAFYALYVRGISQRKETEKEHVSLGLKQLSERSKASKSIHLVRFQLMATRLAIRLDNRCCYNINY